MPKTRTAGKVFWTTLSFEAAVFAAFGILTFLVLYGGFFALEPSQFDSAGNFIMINGRPVRIPVGPVLRFAAGIASAAIALATAAGMAADWPTFAQLDAWSRKDISPLFRSARRKFNPGVPDVMAEAEVVTKALDWESRIIGGTHVGWVVRETGPVPLLQGDAAIVPVRRSPAPSGVG